MKFSGTRSFSASAFFHLRVRQRPGCLSVYPLPAVNAARCVQTFLELLAKARLGTETTESPWNKKHERSIQQKVDNDVRDECKKHFHRVYALKASNYAKIIAIKYLVAY